MVMGQDDLHLFLLLFRYCASYGKTDIISLFYHGPMDKGLYVRNVRVFKQAFYDLHRAFTEGIRHHICNLYIGYCKAVLQSILLALRQSP